jgi:hypothetical protein
MADTKISALPASTTPLAGTEVLPIVQSSTTRQVSVANLTAGRAISATQLTLTTGNLIVASGQGIDFSATSSGAGTMTSELLNDYEEGTWTPVVGSGIDSPTYAAQTGRYTKIGRMVYVQCYLSVDGGTRNGGGLTVGGLPFTMGTFAGAGGSITFASGGLAQLLATSSLPTLQITGTSAYLYKTTGADFLGNDLSAAAFRIDFAAAYNT